MLLKKGTVNEIIRDAAEAIEITILADGGSGNLGSSQPLLHTPRPQISKDISVIANAELCHFLPSSSKARPPPSRRPNPSAPRKSNTSLWAFIPSR